MKGVIFAGGEGNRLRPLTTVTAKSLLPLINRPILDYLIYILADCGCDEVIVVVDHLKDQIVTYLADTDFPVPVRSYEVKSYSGSAMLIAELSDDLDDETIVFPGDCIFDFSFKQVLDQFHKSQAELGMVLRKELDPIGKGGVIVEPDGRLSIWKKSEQPQRNEYALSDSLVYYIQKPLIEEIKTHAIKDIHLDLVGHCLNSGKRVSAVIQNGFWAILGRIHPYLATNFWLLQNMGSSNYIGANAKVDESATLVEPYFVAEDCVVEKNAVIGPNAILNKGCQIEAEVAIDNAILYENAKIGAGTSISFSVLAANVDVGEYTQIGPLCIVGEGASIRAMSSISDGARVNAHEDIAAKSVIDEETLGPSSRPDGLSELELRLYLLINEHGELTYDRLLEHVTEHFTEVNEALGKMGEKGLVVKTESNPPLYTTLIP